MQQMWRKRDEFSLLSTLSSDWTVTLSPDVFSGPDVNTSYILIIMSHLASQTLVKNFNEVEEQVGTEAIGAKKRLGASAAGVVLCCGVFFFFFCFF